MARRKRGSSNNKEDEEDKNINTSRRRRNRQPNNKEEEEDKKHRNISRNVIILIQLLIIITIILPVLIYILRKVWFIIHRFTPVGDIFSNMVPRPVLAIVDAIIRFVVSPTYNTLMTVIIQIAVVLLIIILIIYAIYLIIKHIVPIKHTLLPGKIREPLLDTFPFWLFKKNELLGFFDIFTDYILINSKYASNLSTTLNGHVNSGIIVPAKSAGFKYKEDDDVEVENKPTPKERLIEYVKAQNKKVSGEDSSIMVSDVIGLYNAWKEEK